MDGTMGNVTDNDTDQASFTALASRPRGLRVSTGGSVGSAATGTSTSALGMSRDAVRRSSASAASRHATVAAAQDDDMPGNRGNALLLARESRNVVQGSERAVSGAEATELTRRIE
jgi:hypothetical protein